MSDVDPKIIETTNLIREQMADIDRITILLEQSTISAKDIYEETLEGYQVRLAGLRRYLDTLIHRTDHLGPLSEPL